MRVFEALTVAEVDTPPTRPAVARRLVLEVLPLEELPFPGNHLSTVPTPPTRVAVNVEPFPIPGARVVLVSICNRILVTLIP